MPQPYPPPPPNQNDVLKKDKMETQKLEAPHQQTQNIILDRLTTNQSPILQTDEYAKLNQGVPLSVKNLNPESIEENSKVLLTQPEAQPQEEETPELLKVNHVPISLLSQLIYGPVIMDKIFSVKFSRVKNNILNALTFLYKKNFDKSDMSESFQKDRINAWKDKLKSGYNQRIINDGFWLIVLKKNRGKFFPHEYTTSQKGSKMSGTTRKSQSRTTNTLRSTNPFRVSKYSGTMRRQKKGSRYSNNSRSMQTKCTVRSKKFKQTFDGKYDEEQFFDDKELEDIYNNIENAILDRMAENYIEFMIGCDGKEKELFFQIYFDIVAQGVFYSFFYAFPKSRLQFDDEYKKFVFHVFAELFTGLKITYKSQFIKGWTFVTNWKLDLGAGDVLQQIQRDSDKTHLPALDKRKLHFRNKKRKMELNKLMRAKGEKPNQLKYSPIMQRYLNLKNYKTKNFLKAATMKMTPYDTSQDKYELKFQKYKGVIKNAARLANKFSKQIKEGTLNEEMNRKIRLIKKESLLHNKMLEEKRKAEIEKGSYEYANYLVSMLNAGTNNYIIDK